MTTASFKHDGLIIYLDDRVYTPAEDTYLILNAIQPKKNQSVLELGTGCGIIALICAQKGCRVTCTDKNPHSVRLTYKTINTNSSQLKGKIQVLQGDLFTPIRPKKQFDLIVFNPPYLPTTKEEITGDNWLDLAVNGGKNGLKYTIPFTQQLPTYLKPTGEAYCIVSSLSDLALLNEAIQCSSLYAQTVASASFENETLLVYRFSQQQ